MIDLFQVDHCGECVELFKHVIRAFVVDKLRDSPSLVGSIAESDRSRWTCFRACSCEFIGLDTAMLERRAVLRFANSLHAETALLHHALSTHGDVGIELPVE